MKTKNIIIILLLIAAGSGLAVIFNVKNSRPIRDRQAAVIKDEPIIQPEEIARPEVVDTLAEEKIGAVMIIGEAKYEAEVKPGSSVYDLMAKLKEQNKIDFKSSNYSGLGFFVEEINGIKNNSAGKNWLYYINGKPAPVGISSYKVKSNDIIEWKYEKKTF